MTNRFCPAIAAALLLLPVAVRADSIGAEYSAQFAFTSFTTPSPLSVLGGLAIDPNNPNVLLIGANADTSSGEIYALQLTRDPVTHRITGIGSPTFYAFAPDIDGGLAIAPDDDLLFTEYPNNEVGELKPGSTTPDATVAAPLTSVQASTGGMTFIPAGMPGAGNVVFTSYNHGVVCAATATPNGSGTYAFSSCGNTVQASSVLEGIVYVPGGTSGFASPAVLMYNYSPSTGWSTQVYQVDGNGLPVLSSATTLMNGGANEGMAIDPVTGDILGTFYDQGAGAIYDIYSTATPEPASAEMAALGLAVLIIGKAGAGWRRAPAPARAPEPRR